MAPPKRPLGQAIQVVCLQDDPKASGRNCRNLKLDTAALRDITRKAGTMPIAVIAIAGPTRGGKSFSLSYIARYLAFLEISDAEKSDAQPEALVHHDHDDDHDDDWMRKMDATYSIKENCFKFSNDTERTTDGIWMWSKPFVIHPEASSGPIAVLLVDTEGCFDAYSSEAEQSAIVGLSLLTSSLFIFNESKKINENTLTTLARFMQYGQLAVETFESKSFQRILFLVRDWNFPSKFEYGAAGGKGFINNFLSPAPRMSTEAITNRRLIADCFEDVNCYLMPFPGDGVISEDFTGSVEEMAENFKNHLNHLVASLVADLSVKKIMNQQDTLVVNGDGYYKMFAQYVDAFNSEEMPTPKSILRATMYSVYECHLVELVELYAVTMERQLSKEKMRATILPEKIEKIHSKSKNSVLQKFDGLKSFSEPQIKQISRQQLEQQIDQKWAAILSDLERQKKALLDSAEKRGIQEFQNSLKNSMPNDNEFVLWPLDEFQGFVESAKKNSLQQFLNGCQNPGKKFSNLVVPPFLHRVEEIAQNLWLKMETRKTSIIQQLTSRVDQSRQFYVENMKIHFETTEDEDQHYQPPNLLKKFHEKNLQKSLSLYTDGVKGCQFSTELLDTFRHQLVEEIGEEFKKIENQNLEKFQTIQSRLEVIINEAVTAFNEQAHQILDNVLTADVDQMVAAHDEILECGLQCLDEEFGLILDGQNFTKFKSKLKSMMGEQLQKFKTKFHESIDRKRAACSNLVEDSVQKFCQKFQDQHQILVNDGDGGFQISKIQQEIELLTHETRQFCEDSINQLNFTEGPTYLIQLDHQMSQKSEEFMEILKQAQSSLEAVIEKGAREYEKEMEKLMTDLNSLEKLQLNHTSLASAAVQNFEKDFLHIVQQSKFLQAASSRGYFEKILHQKLTHQLKFYEEDLSSKLNEQENQLETAKQDSILGYQLKAQEVVDKNPFLSEQDLDLKHDKLVLDQVTQFRKIVKEKFSKKSPKIYRPTLSQLKEELEAQKFFLFQQAEKMKVEVEEKLGKIVESCWSTYENSLNDLTLNNDDLSPPDLETKCRQLIQETEQLFDQKCFLPSGDQKEQARTNLNQKMRQKITQMNQEKLAEKQLVDSFMAEILQNFCPHTAIYLDQGLIFKMDGFETSLQSAQKDAMDQLTGQLGEKNIMATAHHLTEFEGILEEKMETFRTLQSKNFDQVKSQAEKNVEDFCTEKKSEIKSQKGLHDLEPQVLGHALNFVKTFSAPPPPPGVNHDDGEDDSCCPTLVTMATELAQKSFQSIVDQLTAVAGSKSEEILNGALKKYNKTMKSYLDQGNAVHPESLLLYSQQSIDLCLREAERRHIVISEGQRVMVKNRLVNSYRIFMEKNNLEAAQASNLAIGIDLGTTTSCVSIYQNGKVTVMKDASGRSLTPSYVYYPDKSTGLPPTVGREAKDQAQKEPENVVFDAKRLIGRQFSDPVVQEDMKTWPFEVQDDGADRPLLMIRGTPYRPEEVSAQVLIRMKQIADDFLNTNVTKAVITVPANFKDGQRDATRQAAQVAGLQVLQIINEPTAAAMAHALTWKDEERTVLVFDFGGGTFDVSVLRTGNLTQNLAPSSTSEPIDEKIAPKTPNSGAIGTGLTVLSTLGDTHLGGEDFDSNLVNFCAAQFEKLHGQKLLEKLGVSSPTVKNLNSPDAVNRRLRRLRDACELAKNSLTTSEKATISLDAIYGPQDFDVDIKRSEFEVMNEPLFQRAIDCVRQALEIAKIDRAEVSDVLMVGGSSRIPRVQKLLAEFLGMPAIHVDQKNIDIQEAVACGAGIQACILNGQDLAAQLPKVKDVQPFTLGIEVLGGKMSGIIKRNSTIPCQKLESYVTTRNNQESARIVIYSGEDKKVEDNDELGSFTLTGIPPGPKGTQELQVRMRIDDSGILEVTATCISTGGSQNLIIEEGRGRLSEGQIKEMRKKATGF